MSEKNTRKNILAPSILAADFSVLGQQIKEAAGAGAEYIHIDVMDGVFVPSISFGMPLIQSIRKVTDKVFDVRLMIVEPDRYVKQFKECGADRPDPCAGMPGRHVHQTEDAGRGGQEVSVEDRHAAGDDGGAGIRRTEVYTGIYGAHQAGERAG